MFKHHYKKIYTEQNLDYTRNLSSPNTSDIILLSAKLFIFTVIICPDRYIQLQPVLIPAMFFFV